MTATSLARLCYTTGTEILYFLPGDALWNSNIGFKKPLNAVINASKTSNMKRAGAK